MKRILLVLIVALNIIEVTGQTVKGVVTTENREVVPFATISVLRVKDSVLLKAGVADKDGRFAIAAGIDSGVLLQITASGYANQYLQVTGTAGTTIVLKKLSSSLKEVVVSVKKPMIEVRPDKLVFNVESSINATGSNGLELLQKSPGVIVDKDDNIILSGKNGVKIYIDGKPTPLTNTDLSAYLRGVSSSDIEAIEIITNPSARYDAEGNAGIINIRMKKNKISAGMEILPGVTVLVFSPNTMGVSQSITGIKT